MIAAAASRLAWPAPAGERQRRVMLLAVMAGHAGLIWLALWTRVGLPDPVQRLGGSAGGAPNVFELSRPGVVGGGDGDRLSGRAAAPSAPGERPVTDSPAATTGRAPGGESALRLGDDLASALADDPLAGGGRADYHAVLRRHIVAYASAPEGFRARAGLVVFRFRIARDGSILDARILRAPDNLLGEAALATLWRAEPMPVVPADLPVPLEVDVPIDFQLRR